MDYSAQDVEDAVLFLESFLEFNVLVPKGVCQKVLTAALCTSLEQSR